ncbi:tetratricopeptide repeat-containing sulfotransferase family protein [Pseudoalteromonas tunicata]|uniref:tetratricopeptide repeat-containing sulfotransferase family protein n=1 Tax=Pseudoalteromonas tunicata TaxID=314281 RepID=UPI00273E63F3|nr:tetratricopeptide repeat-containing sulfotransferase family protein [Pseudoalteromonas tunicata]MDP4984892.1 sulfotransferase [Pseudoalteromonas tunicata]
MPHSAAILHQHALKALQAGDIRQAHTLLVNLVTLDPKHADGYFLLAMVNVQVGQIKKAISLIEKALGFNQTIEYLAHLAKCYALNGQTIEAKKIALAITIDNVPTGIIADTLGVTLTQIGLYQAAMPFFKKAVTLQSSNAQFYYNLGVCAKFMGDFSLAELVFEQALSLNPKHHQTHFALADLIKVTAKNNHIERLTSAFIAAIHPDAQLHLGHALAKEYQDIGHYHAAFKALYDAKQAKWQQQPFDEKSANALFAHIKQLSGLNQQTSHIGCESHEPIFILGMPRSGTTLVERILSSHSEVTSAGERQDFGLIVKQLANTPSSSVLDCDTISQAYLADFKQMGERYLAATRVVTGDSAHFIDKLPFNFYYVDLIRKALPNAKIICLLRDPLDTCIGNFRQLFTINNPYYAYSLDLMTTARFYQQFHQLICHWQTVHSDAVKIVRYESLVAEPEKVTRDLLAYCNLPWQDSCLNFHLNQAPVSTASKMQVREPINDKSIGRWKKFKPYTDELEAFFNEHSLI